MDKISFISLKKDLLYKIQYKIFEKTLTKPKKISIITLIYFKSKYASISINELHLYLNKIKLLIIENKNCKSNPKPIWLKKNVLDTNNTFLDFDNEYYKYLNYYQVKLIQDKISNIIFIFINKMIYNYFSGSYFRCSYSIYTRKCLKNLYIKIVRELNKLVKKYMKINMKRKKHIYDIINNLSNNNNILLPTPLFHIIKNFTFMR